jgi:hypothetical protein
LQRRIDAWGGVRQWRVGVSDATATIDGLFDAETERTIVAVMARTVLGIAVAASALDVLRTAVVPR